MDKCLARLLARLLVRLLVRLLARLLAGSLESSLVAGKTRCRERGGVCLVLGLRRNWEKEEICCLESCQRLRVATHNLAERDCVCQMGKVVDSVFN